MKYLKSGNKEEELKAPCYRRVNTQKRKRKTVKQPHRDTDGNTPADTPQLPTDYLQIIYRLPIDYFQIMSDYLQVIFRLSSGIQSNLQEQESDSSLKLKSHFIF